MSENRKLAGNVHEFLSYAADIHGRIKADEFSQFVFCELIEGKFQSPIEDIFYIACHLQCNAEFIELNPSPLGLRDGKMQDGYGIFIHPQAKIGKYRVDFLISQSGIGPETNLSPVIIELDGHEFHDKDKKQRAYEKARDRYFVQSGYKVLHFTGSEVIADPHKVAFDSLSLVGLTVGGCREYDPQNPFGIE